MQKTILSTLFILFLGNYGSAQNTKPLAKDILEARGEICFQFRVDDTRQLDYLSKILSIDHFEHKTGIVRAYANARQWDKFQALKIPYSLVDNTKDRVIDMADTFETMSNWDAYPTYEFYVEMMQHFASQYPQICRLDTIGQSVQNRQLLALKISDNVLENETEPKFFYTSSMHGDELTGAVLLLRLADYLLTNYETDSRVTQIVDNLQIWINPLANPDGTYAGGNHTVGTATRYNANYVDLNRNFPDPSGIQHPDGNGTQKENLAMMDFHDKHNFVMSANFHGGAEVVNYPWDTWESRHADDIWFRYVCREYADTVHANSWGYLTGFDNGITNGYDWYTVNGSRQDYTTYYRQGREITMEISDIKLISSSELPYHWTANYRSLLNFMLQANYGMRGLVYDAETGEAIRDAQIYLAGHDSQKDRSWVHTDTAGFYVRLLQAASYQVRVTAEGYDTLWRNVIVDEKTTLVENFEMTKGQDVAITDTPLIDLQLYPNPAITVCYLKTQSQVQQIQVISTTGAQQDLIARQIAPQNYRIDVGELPPGLYLLNVTFDNQSKKCLRFVVAR